MKRIISAILLATIALSATAQGYTPDYNENYKKSRSKVEVTFNFLISYDGLIQDLGHLQLPPDARELAQMGKSIGVDLNFINVGYRVGAFKLATGLGIESNNFRFSKNVSLLNDPYSGQTVIDNTFTERGIHLTKSKLTTTFLNVPLEAVIYLTERRGHGKGTFVSFGVVGGLLLQSYTKTVSPELGTQKNFNDFNLNNFHLGYTATVAIHGFAITAKYYPGNMFRDGQNLNLQQATIGLGFRF